MVEKGWKAAKNVVARCGIALVEAARHLREAISLACALAKGTYDSLAEASIMLRCGA